ncbi:MAG: hypothetical protein DMG96_42320 [Acidobacteria bacterium]|nr:MAG: hypothetical protein DMG96_42320 [Acidobacteriota bacterium]
MESRRKLASSVNISAQFCARAFFNVGIHVALPTIPFGGIGSGQYALRPLHGKTDLGRRI